MATRKHTRARKAPSRNPSRPVPHKVLSQEAKSIAYRLDALPESVRVRLCNQIAEMERAPIPPDLDAVLEVIEEQSRKALNLSGAIEAFKLACRDRQAPDELESGLELLEEEASRIWGALARDELLKEARQRGACRQAIAERNVRAAEASELTGPKTGLFTADDLDRTVLEGLSPALACPFCGQTEDLMMHEEEDVLSESSKWYRVSCGICGVDAPGGPTQAEAAAEWNTRGTPPAARAVRKEARS